MGMVFQKAAVIAGAAALIAGGAIGYGAGVTKERFFGGFGWGQGSGWQEDGSGRGMGMMNRNRDDSGYGKGQRDGERDGSGRQRDGFRGMGGGMSMGGGTGRAGCVADDCLAVDGLDYPVGNLSDAAKQALSSALDDEYKALATYEAVIAKFGSTRPFIMIARSEEQHIAALRALYDKYGMTVPANPYLGKVTAPASLQAACQTGVDAEVANASLYKDKLLPAVKDYADLTAVFTNLMNASQNRHLPAFDRCN
jgi:hypothetical protein